MEVLDVIRHRDVLSKLVKAESLRQSLQLSNHFRGASILNVFRGMVFAWFILPVVLSCGPGLELSGPKQAYWNLTSKTLTRKSVANIELSCPFKSSFYKTTRTESATVDSNDTDWIKCPAGPFATTVAIEEGLNTLTLWFKSQGDSLQSLEDRFVVRRADYLTLNDPNPGATNRFSMEGFWVGGLYELSDGTVLVSDPLDDTQAIDAGAAHAYSAEDGSLLYSVYGTGANEQLASVGISPLANGNFVIATPNYNSGATSAAGRVILFNGKTGATIATLVGTLANDQFGGGSGFSGVTGTSNGNFWVLSPYVDEGFNDNGTATLISGTTGAVIATYAGTKADDNVGAFLTSVDLKTGNFLLLMHKQTVGAFTNAGTAIVVNNSTGAEVGRINGQVANENLGQSTPIVVPNGNFIIPSPKARVGANTNAGSVILGNGVTGVEIGRANGYSANEEFGNYLSYIFLLSNGHYVVTSPNATWLSNANAGAVSLINGNTGTEISRLVGGANVGENLGSNFASDLITSLALTNGNFVVSSSSGDGIIILIDGNTGAEISRYIGSPGEEAGRALSPLPNGNYLSNHPGGGNGKLVVFNGQTGSVVWSVTGQTNEYLALGSASYPIGHIALGNGNVAAVSFFAEVGGIPALGEVKVFQGQSGTLLSAFAGTQNLGWPGNIGNPGGVAVPGGNLLAFGCLEKNANGDADAGAMLFVDGTSGALLFRIEGVANDLLAYQAQTKILTSGNVLVASGAEAVSGLSTAGRAYIVVND
jgi:hypothetical protein